MTYSPSRGRPVLGEGEFGQQFGQVLARKRPLEWTGGGFIPVLESEQRGLEAGEIGEVAGRQHLALDDGKVDLDLVQPTRMNGRENRDQGRPLALKTLHGLRSPMAGTVVHNPE